MSGFAFQKLNGKGTTALKQLDELKDLNEKQDLLLKLQKAQSEISLLPDWVKRACILNDEQILIKEDDFITGINAAKYREFTGAVNTNKNDGEIIDFGALHYGKIQLTIQIDNPTKKEANHVAVVNILEDGNIQQQFKEGYKGRHDWKITAGSYEFVGYFDSLHFYNWFRTNYKAELTYFIEAFEIGEKGNNEYVPNLPQEPTVYNLNMTVDDGVDLIMTVDDEQGVLKNDTGQTVIQNINVEEFLQFNTDYQKNWKKRGVPKIQLSSLNNQNVAKIYINNNDFEYLINAEILEILSDGNPNINVTIENDLNVIGFRNVQNSQNDEHILLGIKPIGMEDFINKEIPFTAEGNHYDLPTNTSVKVNYFDVQLLHWLLVEENFDKYEIKNESGFKIMIYPDTNQIDNWTNPNSQPAVHLEPDETVELDAGYIFSVRKSSL